MNFIGLTYAGYTWGVAPGDVSVNSSVPVGYDAMCEHHTNDGGV